MKKDIVMDDAASRLLCTRLRNNLFLFQKNEIMPNGNYKCIKFQLQEK